jgi:uncharacterized membrane-anchored protein
MRAGTSVMIYAVSIYHSLSLDGDPYYCVRTQQANRARFGINKGGYPPDQQRQTEDRFKQAEGKVKGSRRQAAVNTTTTPFQQKLALPPDHPLRSELAQEVHARPPDALRSPFRVSYLVLLSDSAERRTEWEQFCELLRRFGVTPPARVCNHFSARINQLHLRWERHTEFSRYTIVAPDEGDEPFSSPALAMLPTDWLASLSGQIIVAAHAAFVRRLDTADSVAGSTQIDYEAVSNRCFAGNSLIGATIADQAGTALTDFHIGTDGFSRFLVIDQALTPRQAGRTLQRLLEIETYRMLALLALPAARELLPFLGQSERELSGITTALARAREEDEETLFAQVTRLEAETESRSAGSHYRFSAAAAYYELVQQRIRELREHRIGGLQTFHDFTERRLAPAMNTCRAAASRLQSLSERVSRANQLLATRIDLSNERQNRALLETMNRRAEAQLRLQLTVEGLSVAAVTYYIVGLVGYAAKGLKGVGWTLNPDVMVGISIPLVALMVALGIRRIHRGVAPKSGIRFVEK